MDLDLKIKRIPTPTTEARQFRQRAQSHKIESRVARPAEVPPLNLGKLGDWEEEDVWYVPMPSSQRHPPAGPPDSSSTVSWGLAPPARAYQTARKPFKKTPAPKKPPPWEEDKVVPENLPPPSQKYLIQYQQYQAELHDGFRQQTQRVQNGSNEAKPSKHQTQQPNHGDAPPFKLQPQQASHGDAPPFKLQPQQANHGGAPPTEPQLVQSFSRVEDLTVQDQRALLQQCYTSKPYTLQHSQRKLEAEDLAVLRRKQAVVEQVMVDQLSRAVISDPDQNLDWPEASSLPDTSYAPLRFKKRTLHETKVRTRSALTEHLLSNKLRFDARILSRNGRDGSRELIGFFFAYDRTLTVYEYRQFGKNRTSALPFIPKGHYRHECGRRKGTPYSIHDFYMGANLSFSTQGQNLPETLRQKQVLKLRVTDVDELAKDMLLASTGDIKQGLSQKEREDKNILAAIQETLQGSVKKRGVRTLTGLGKVLRAADTTGEGVLGRAEIRRALEDFQLTLSHKDLDAVWRILDQNGDGRVDYAEFVRGVIGEMNEFRKSFVRKAYMKLDPNKSGSIPMTDVEKFYCAKGHPKVISGESTEAELRAGFIQSLRESCLDPREMSYCEFEDYYEGLSINIHHDQDFANVLKNSWGI